MTQNIMPEVAKMLGVQIGEEFRVRDVDAEQCASYTVVILNGGLIIRGAGLSEPENLEGVVLENLLVGHTEIIKIPQESVREC